MPTPAWPSAIESAATALVGGREDELAVLGARARSSIPGWAAQTRARRLGRRAVRSR